MLTNDFQYNITNKHSIFIRRGIPKDFPSTTSKIYWQTKFFFIPPQRQDFQPRLPQLEAPRTKIHPPADEHLSPYQYLWGNRRHMSHIDNISQHIMEQTGQTPMIISTQEILMVYNLTRFQQTQPIRNQWWKKLNRGNHQYKTQRPVDKKLTLGNS